MAFLKSLFVGFFSVAVILAAIAFIPGIPPDATFEQYSIVPARELPKNLALNEKLNNVEILFQGQVKGPEAFASYDGELYTSAQGGYVLRITNNELVPVVKFGQDCDGLWQESKCGRPLGLKFDKKGILYVNDAYYGIFKVDVKTGKYEQLVDSKDPIEGKRPMLINSLDIASNGDVYWSDSCSNFHLEDGIYCMIANPSGRLIRYNAANKKNQVLVHDLGFANGVALSEDESFVIVSETSTSRITKYNLKGSNAGKSEIFVEGLPGMPDNIHSDTKNGYLISFAAYADSQNPILPQFLIPYPNLRRLAARLLMLLEAPFKCLQSYYPNYFTEQFIHFVGGFESIIFIVPNVVVVARMNKNGEIIDAAYGTNRKMSGITSAYIHDGFLWLGSDHAEFLGRVPLQQVFPDLIAPKLQNYNANTKESKTDSPPKPMPTQKSDSATSSSKVKKSKSAKADTKNPQ
ncbi:adipocyte plasma membrane-associated protein-like [Copidosoma floridanum]|uniref:adipocyte plasma membrane-associated protein-like n=1 Tax=Copidosoma floridanum TaxID=29053 RepID=UPI0006C9E274|nr:adipocyte plasma membrane-associated protein-like [Copidosoma floridanum]